MSYTYHLICQDCKQRIWIGQGWPEGEKSLYKTEDSLGKIERFLFSHIEHTLVFSHDNLPSYETAMDDGYVEIDKEIT